jgi:hypothetical protein
MILSLLVLTHFVVIGEKRERETRETKRNTRKAENI